jgi:hypothetical protein
VLEVAERALKNSQSTKEAWYLKSIAGGKTKEFNVTSPWASKISSAALHAGLYRKDRETFLYWSEFETILIGNGSANIAKIVIQTVSKSSVDQKEVAGLYESSIELKRANRSKAGLYESSIELKRANRSKEFEILLISISDALDMEVTVDSERHFAVGGVPARGDLAIQGRSDTIVETTNRASDIHTESYVSSSSRISSLTTRLLTCEVKQEKSFRVSEY